VSPLWRDELGIYLAPQRVCAVRLKRGLKPAVSGEYEQALESDHVGHWGAALTAADALLSQPQWGGAAVRVVLVIENHTGMVELLLARGADVNARTIVTLAAFACCSGAAVVPA
jgi:hypothetical protein